MSVLFVVILFITLLLYPNINKSRKGFFLMFFFIFAIYIFIDKSSLPDILPYKLYYESIRRFDWTHTYGVYDSIFEPGWFLISYLSHKINADFNFFYAIYAAILSCIYVLTIRKYSPYPKYSLLICVLSGFFSLFILRQYLSIAICLITIPHIISKRLLPFLFITMVAVSMHTTAVLWLFVFPLYHYIQSWSRLFVFIGLMTILLFAVESVVSFIYPLIGKEGSYISDLENETSLKSLFMPTTTLLLAIIVYGRDIINIHGIEKLFILIAFISFYLEMINQVGTSFTAIYRLKMLFSVSGIYIVPLTVSKIRNREFRFFILLFYILLYLVSFISNSNAFGGIRFI